MGPFQIYDVIGLTTPYNILAHGDEKDQKLAAWLKENYIDQGKLGIASGSVLHLLATPGAHPTRHATHRSCA
nr:3-hydroxyacyl-CoA dehydrogenase family protein [Arthrobacter sp. JCM 19049]